MNNRKIMIIGILCFVFLLILIQSRSKVREVTSMQTLPLMGRIIYIDPGHGGVDSGARNDHILEKEIALDVSLKLRNFLQAQGANVIMTRDGDYDLADVDMKGLSRRKTADLHKRLEVVNESKADLFISIHLNSIPSQRWRGAQTFYTERFKENKQIAEIIQEELITNLKNTDRQAKTINNVFLLNEVKKPSALVEIGFLSNPQEKELLVDDKYQTEVAVSIMYGIMKYFLDGKEGEEV